MSSFIAVSPVSRRILLYWLLLLIPTILVGIGAMQLLRREEGKLAGQQALAGEARRAAVTGRTSLIVENIELLVADVQSGLLESLASFHPPTLDRELEEWERANPLVRTAFRATDDGRILRPGEDGADEEARGFRRRFGELFATQPPWREGHATLETKAELQAQSFNAKLRSSYNRNELEAREQVSQNVAQVQLARRDAQATSKYRSADLRERTPAAGAAPEKAESDLAAADTAVPLAAFAAPAAAPAVAGERSGWSPWISDGRLHLLGWLERGGEIRGVEVEVSALIARLGAALPVEPAAGEGFVLRDGRGRVMHQVGWAPRGNNRIYGTLSRSIDGEPAVRLPVAASVLPGWEVIAFLDVPEAQSSSGQFLFVGSVLVAILLVAILAGGSLLFWQARRSEAEAAQKTSFVANVSHEFKTPLTTIRLYSELLEQGRVANEAKRTEYLRTIGRETQRLSRLVGNALDFSRLEQGRKKFAHDAIDLRAELERLLDTHAPRFSEAGIRVARSLGTDPVPVTGDRDAVEQILLNLLDNAAKHAAAGGEIAVALERRNERAFVRVMDRGPGVPAAHRERIFEKFHRVDDTLTAEKTGAGLGLSIARQLARGMGGDLRHESRDGGGSTFILELA